MRVLDCKMLMMTERLWKLNVVGHESDLEVLLLFNSTGYSEERCALEIYCTCAAMFEFATFKGTLEVVVGSIANISFYYFYIRIYYL